MSQYFGFVSLKGIIKVLKVSIKFILKLTTTKKFSNVLKEILVDSMSDNRLVLFPQDICLHKITRRIRGSKEMPKCKIGSFAWSPHKTWEVTFYPQEVFFNR